MNETTQTSLKTKLQALLDRMVGKGNIYNAVAGVQSRDGKLDWAGAAGIADPATGAAMTPDTEYALASVSKMYTAAVIMKLHEQGRLSLDERIAQYLPGAWLEGLHVHEGRDYSREIKVYQLLSQTSGLADYFEGKPDAGQGAERSIFEELQQGHDVEVSIERVVAAARSMKPRFAPGAQDETKAAYSDTNFQLLGAIIECVTEQPLAAVFEQMIFQPLGLQHTYVYSMDALRAGRRFATIYMRDRPLFTPKFFATTAADGGVIATVRESITFLRAFFDGTLFDATYLERMTKRWNAIFFPMQYGYGLMRLNLPRFFSPFRRLPELIGHSGASGSFAYYSPDRGLYLAGTINQIAAPSKPINLMLRIVNLVRSS